MCTNIARLPATGFWLKHWVHHTEPVAVILLRFNAFAVFFLKKGPSFHQKPSSIFIANTFEVIFFALAKLIGINKGCRF